MERFRSAPIKLSDQAIFGDNQIPKRVQLLRVGQFFNGGKKVDVTKEVLSRMITNFSENVRGVDLMIDYSHDSEGEAAAWISTLYLENEDTELWAEVNWTEAGQDSVLKKKFRYLSADFAFNYVNNETLAEYGPTLFGAGLTNRPVVKGMAPVIQLSEKEIKYKENQMDLEELKKMLEELKMQFEQFKNEMMKKEDEEVIMEAERKKLAEKEKQMMEDNAKLSEKIKTLEKEGEFNKLFAEGKVVEAQREAFLADDMVKFSENAATIQTSNAGGQGGSNNKVEDAEAKVIELAEKKVSEDKITFSEAIVSVLKENKELAEEYNKKFNN